VLALIFLDLIHVLALMFLDLIHVLALILLVSFLSLNLSWVAQLGVQSRDDEPLGVHGHNKKDDDRNQIKVWPNPVKILEDEELKTCGKVTSVACGLEHTVMTVAGGQVLVCGESANGQVGLGSTAACIFPLDVHGMRGKQMRVAAGGNHNLAWGCENGYSNKIRRRHSVWSSEPYMRDAEDEQYQRWVQGLGPRPSVSVPELHIATGEVSPEHACILYTHKRNAYIHVYIHANIQTNVHTHTHTHTFPACIHTHTYTHTSRIHTYIHTCDKAIKQ